MSAARDLIRVIPDYPLPGIRFQDLTPLLSDGSAFSAVVHALKPQTERFDVIAGIEARGFIFAAALAHSLSLGFIPIRKKGKLPFLTHAESYGLEYGQDVIQIHQDALSPGSRVLLIDDVLATGGTAVAGIRLLQRAGGHVVGFSSVLEITGLSGREVITAAYPKISTHSLFKV
ncbi:MAG: adenine phosphoribosyltransferase [Actinobacteria bacterium]|nr:adenine phosphoribosyltransferase [Actinomycetota bacterium]